MPQTPQAQGMAAEFQGAPDWVRSDCTKHFSSDKKLICGVGSVSGMTNPGLARSAAEGRGRTEIARNLQVRLTAMLKDHQASTNGGAGNKNASEQHITDTAKQITSTTLAGTHLEDSWISGGGSFYALMVLEVDAFKDAVGSMKELEESMRVAIVARAEQSFAELDDETRRADATRE